MKDVLRGALCTPPINVADVTYNKNVILQRIKQAQDSGAAVLVFPELSLTGYTCGDLFSSQVLLCAAQDALGELAAATADILVGTAQSVRKERKLISVVTEKYERRIVAVNLFWWAVNQYLRCCWKNGRRILR